MIMIVIIKSDTEEIAAVWGDIICRVRDSRKIKLLVFGIKDGNYKVGRPHRHHNSVNSTASLQELRTLHETEANGTRWLKKHLNPTEAESKVCDDDDDDRDDDDDDDADADADGWNSSHGCQSNMYVQKTDYFSNSNETAARHPRTNEKIRT